MSSRKALILAGILVGSLLLGAAAGRAEVSRAGYNIRWSVLGGGGGPTMSGGGYTINSTLGQTGIGAASGSGYQAGSGFWYGVERAYAIYLPITMRDFSP